MDGFEIMGEVVLGISGASGAIYGVRLAQALNELGVGIRLVVSDSGRITLKHECDTPRKLLQRKLEPFLKHKPTLEQNPLQVLHRLMLLSFAHVQAQRSANLQQVSVTI